jgi:membrane-bound lytic murein transglycosylase B
MFLGLLLSPVIFNGAAPLRTIVLSVMLKRNPILKDFHAAFVKNKDKHNFNQVKERLYAAIAAEDFNEAEFREAFAGMKRFRDSMHEPLAEDFITILSKYPHKDRLKLVKFMEKRLKEMPKK